MASNPTLSKLKVIMNAEAFGFGPTAAIASFFPELRNLIGEIAYIGEGHSLNLQKSLAYNHIYDCSFWDKQNIEKTLKHYDILITAADFTMAERAKNAGLNVIIYDPLAWFWRTMPQAIKTCDLYLAQNFIGVEEALHDFAPHMASPPIIVPPILQNKHSQRYGENILINFGGLINPFWQKEDAVHYAKTMYGAIKSILPSSTAHCLHKRRYCPSFA
mgnify:CR=1 FL=1